MRYVLVRFVAAMVFAIQLVGCAVVDSRYPPVAKPTVQKHMVSIARNSLASMKEVDALLRINNSILASEISAGLTAAASDSDDLAISDMFVRFGRQSITLRGDVDFSDSEGNTVSGTVQGDVIIAMGGSEVTWLPHFTTLEVSEENFTFGGEFFAAATNALLDRFLDNLNGEIIRHLITGGENTIALAAMPLDQIDLQSEITGIAGASGAASQKLGGVFTISGSSILITPKTTTLALDLEFIANVSNCPSDLKVNRSAFARGVEGREPVGITRGISSDENVRFFFTEIAAKEQTNVYHYWFSDGRPAAIVRLEVGESPSWRTYSSKQLGSNSVRVWEVLVVEEQTGCILHSSAIRMLPDAQELNNASKEEAARAFELFESEFLQRLQDFKTSQTTPSIASLEVPLDFLGTVLNASTNELGVVIRYDASEIGRQSFSSELQPFDHSAIACNKRKCSSNRRCSTNFRKCRASKDKRNCKACLLRRPWDNGCVQRGNDPICEAAKASQNLAYQAEAEACRARENLAKLDCERLKAQEIAACEIESSFEKATCETAKQVVKSLERQGSYARISGNADPSGQISATFSDFTFSNDLSSFEFDLGVNANLNVDGSIRFVPKGPLGPLTTCISAWKESYSSRVVIPETVQRVKGTLAIDPVQITLNWSSHTFKIGMSPSPVESIFVENPHFLANCHIGLSIAGVAELISGEDSGFFTGDFEVEVDPSSTKIELTEAKLRTRDQEYSGDPDIDGQFLRYVF